MASEPRRLTTLPGYDTAPDVYETADTADDTSTQPLSSPRSASASETSDTTDEEDEESYGVSRRRLYPERARSRFGQESRGVSVGKRGVDLSDRVDGRRKGFRRRRRDVVGEGDEEEEGLEARIARLRREIEECRVQSAQARAGADDTEEGHEDEVDGLSRLLASIDAPAGRQEWTRQRVGAAQPDVDAENEPDEQTLGRVSDFDSRLSSLESALGISALDSLNPDTNAVATPLLPTLNLLDSQLAALTTATSLSSLEAASSRLQQLTTSTSKQEGENELSSEDLTKLQSLYTLLPTLQSLAPTIPPLLSRLRSLRHLHTSAANAAAELDEVEQRQAEMDSELKAWKTGLEKVEQAVAEANEGNGRNGKIVQGWVSDLEERMKTLR